MEISVFEGGSRANDQVNKLEHSLVESELGCKPENYLTLDKEINEKYGKVKEDIINFVCLGNAGVDSKKLEEIYRRLKRGEISAAKIEKIVGPNNPSIDYLCRSTVKQLKRQKLDWLSRKFQM